MANNINQGLAALRSTVDTTSNLIERLQISTVDAESVPYTVAAPVETQQNKTANALNLAHDAASLIRAHSTKLSLLIINKPFTPSAINNVLRELIAGPLPGLASAVELCDHAIYGKNMSTELRWRARKTFLELGKLVQMIPLDGSILSDDQKNGTGAAAGKGSLASTGVLWEACDAVMELKISGVAGLAIKRAEEYRDLLKDALEELQEWAEEESDDDDDDDVDDEEREEAQETMLAQDAIDSMFATQRHIPRDDPDKIRERLECSMKKLRLIILMYQAVVKRRFKILPALPHPELPPELESKSSEDPGIIPRLDAALDAMKKIPEITDELANAFYELDVTGIDKIMKQCFSSGFSSVEGLLENWEAKEDNFTTWAHKFQLAMNEGW